MDAARLGAFELKAYADQDLTLDQLNAYYHELCVRSEETSDFAQTTYGWELVPHLFGSPCYYVSYGTSAANALELLLRSWKDFDQGAEIYLDLVAQTDTQGYVGAVEAAGTAQYAGAGVPGRELTRGAGGIPGSGDLPDGRRFLKLRRIPGRLTAVHTQPLPEKYGCGRGE